MKKETKSLIWTLVRYVVVTVVSAFTGANIDGLGL